MASPRTALKPDSILSPRQPTVTAQPAQVPKLSFIEGHERRVRSASGVRKPARLKAGGRTAQPYSSATAYALSARLPEITKTPQVKSVSEWPTEVTGETLTLDLSRMAKGTSASAMMQMNDQEEHATGAFPAWYTPRGSDLTPKSQPKAVKKPLLSTDRNSKPQRLPVPPQVNTPKREDPSLRCTHDSEMQREKPSFVNRKCLSDAKMLASANRRAGKIRFEGISYYKMGVLHDNLKEYKQAIVQYKKFLKICQRTNDTVGEALAYNCIAVDYHLMGGPANLAKAVEYHTKHRDIADIPGKFTCFSNLGLVYQEMGELDKAVHNHQSALRHAIHMSSLEGESVACANLGATGAAHGEISTARACAERHLQLAASMRDPRAEAEAHKQLGELAIASGDYDYANTEFHQALEISQSDLVAASENKSARCAIGLARGNERLEEHLRTVAAQLSA